MKKGYAALSGGGTGLKAVMLQGTASDVGKSVLCTALCRIFYEDGYRVAPFKAQNMALNSYITADGGEIGRAQGVQAEACGIEATVDMNPILLKPKRDMVAEVIVRGKHYADAEASAYGEEYVRKLLPVVKDSLRRLSEEYDILVIEGAGSPAEINLKHRDIANMRVAELADAPVVLVADIDRGGVFASIVGTLALLEKEERERVKGFVINKFRGKRSLLQPGLDWLEKETGLPVLAVIPYVETGIEAEDSLALQSLRLKQQDESAAALNVHVIRLPHISNFTDMDPLYDEPGVNVRLVSRVSDWGNPDIILVPGTKNTTEDLIWLQQSGLAARIVTAAERGAHVVGICGGYQILGKKLFDPHGVESTHEVLDGLGLLPVETTFVADKITVRTEGRVIGGRFALDQRVTGYEIHLGRTKAEQGSQPFIRLADGRADGTVAYDGRVWGTYFHGIFHNRSFTRAWLNHIRREKGMEPVAEHVVSESARREASYRALASIVRSHFDIQKLYQIMGLR